MDYIKLEGNVDDIIFSNKETGFTVLDLNSNGELINVVGNLFGVEEGEDLKLTGYYSTHKTYGYQFNAVMFERSLPVNQSAMIKYLSSGVIKGVGPAVAKKIVEAFGDDTFSIIEKTPHRLSEIKGITAKKADSIADEFKEIFGVRCLMSFLSSQGINAVQSVSIFKRWGVMALDLIKQNPYILIKENVDFALADNIAKNLSIPLDSPLRICAGLEFVLMHNSNNGFTCLPKDKLIITVCKLLGLETDLINTSLEQMLFESRLYSYNTSIPLIYLPCFYLAQKYICSRLQIMINVYSNQDVDADDTIALIEENKNINYEGLQKKAINQAVKQNVFILTGGPGTGKTTTLNAIIEILEQQGKKVSIAAPTGRAAKRISEVTGKEAKTIHRLLEVEMGYAKTNKLEFVHNEQNPLECDVVIIDEMSMIDTLLFESLLRGMKPSAKLIMVGDFHQLPSVGAGNILHDLIESDTIPSVELKFIFRQAAKSLIVTNAHKIVNGEMPELTTKNNDFFFLPFSDNTSCADTIVDLCYKRLPKAYKFSPTEDIQVLSPQRKGELGVIEINNKLQQVLNPKKNGIPEFKNGIYTFRLGDKVMQTRNNYDIEWKKGEESGTGIFNGDIGIIKMIDKGSSTVMIDFEDRLCYYNFDMTNELELAYAITVHKSQGSEFEAIILPIMNGFDKLYFRNLLYTAVTRAKKILIIVGQKSRIEFMINNNIKMLRYTGLKEMLCDCVFNNDNEVDENEQAK